MKITQNNKCNWVIDFTCKGRRIRRVIGPSKREAEDAVATIKADIVRERYGFAKVKKVVMFEGFAKDYLNLYAKQNKRSWKRDEVSLSHLIPFFRKRSLLNITPDLIERYKAKRKEEVSPATVNRELACLKTLFSKAMEWGKVEADPTKRIKLFKENNGKDRILNSEEATSLIAAAVPHLKPILIIALNTGMRRGEILSLKWRNINLVNGYIFIEDSKSGKSRKVPMNSLVLETFRNIKRVHEYVFYNPQTKTHIKDIKTAFKSACRDAGIKGLRLHDLRHTAATGMVEAGVDLVTVSKILGHSTIQMTMRYAHPTPENMQRAVDKLGETFKKYHKKVETLTNMSEMVHSLILYN